MIEPVELIDVTVRCKACFDMWVDQLPVNCDRRVLAARLEAQFCRGCGARDYALDRKWPQGYHPPVLVLRAGA